MKYDDEGNLVSVTSTDLADETAQYDANNNLIQQVTGGNGTFDYTYDTTYKHRLLSVTNNPVTQSMTYDGVGNVTQTTLSNSVDGKFIQTNAAYSADGHRVTSSADAAGNAVFYAYGDNNAIMRGQATHVTAPNNAATVNTYDSLGRVTKTEVGTSTTSGIVEEAELVYTYDGERLSQIQRNANRNGSSASQTYYMGYDNFGNVTQIKVGNRVLSTSTIHILMV